ncbi:PGPGW domain-containing protein [Parahaliea aestuarii]|uniref:Transmembrane protein (PGPGW) n=1 Tax=Parahaliea aestuarii TaxID=1852021 RepID=A0A5C9A597_9GAMM|nr:PGPGW domain-containing protein [Parahaliea aestuarii]TXS94827.1 hypothetical protein FVW59_02660 [Parahaliea aestuarii]
MDFVTQHAETLLAWVAGISLLMLIGTVVVMPLALSRLPVDYFNAESRRSWRDMTPYPPLSLLLVILKNVVGLMLLALGILLLFTPGQGVVTILVGLMLMNFPGKYRLERKLALTPGILRAINWLRQRAGSAPMEAPR